MSLARSPAKDGLVHRSAQWGMLNEVARCGVLKRDGYAIHSAGRFTTCQACLAAAPVRTIPPERPRRPYRKPVFR